MIPNEAIASGTLNALLYYSSVLGILLVIGVFIRIKIKVLKKYFIPASLIAGFVGLLLGPYGVKLFSEEMVGTWGSIAGILITIVFAPMLIGMKSDGKKEKGTSKLVIRHLIYSYAGSLLQISIPLIVAALILIPIWDLNAMFATIIEVGWAGGHGTAAGMTEAYINLGWEDGASLGVTSATLGIVIGIISGIVMINHGVKKGYTSILKGNQAMSSQSDEDAIPLNKQKSNAVNTLNPDMVESFAFHMGLILIAVFIGWFMQQFLAGYVQGIPLFPLAMIGGLLVNMVISKTKYFHLIDVNTLRRIQGLALDFLIIGAVASIKVPIVVQYWLPLLILTVITFFMMLWYFYYLGRRIFNEEWFENAIVHYGSYTGVAAVGLMLLRTADPEMKTDSGKAYALRAPFYSPFLGGGLLTALVPVLVIKYGALSVGIGSLAIFIVIILLSRLFGLYNKPQMSSNHQASYSEMSK
ncbi:sodium/glutamate symporter [Cytobacillus praedii]|uniref:sodium/glutamate symporter n=1 Tax=Cytobacillus praedii TaxID=1742358 RepID=UPI002E1BDC38|nr:sodium/glutamate symporter [Cytobacillus praedii]MED3571316.1 sodium/glutamate symporter [Cytobacillus praedii]